MERLPRLVTAHPWAVVGLVVAMTLPFAVSATRVRVDSSVETLVGRDDPEAKFHEEAKALFGTDEVDVVALVTDDVFAPAALRKVQALSERLAKIRGVAKVTSLATVEMISATADGGVEVAPVMEEVPVDADGLGRLRARVRDDPLLGRLLVAPDGRAAAILIAYEEMSDAAFVASGIHAEVEEVVRSAEGPERLYLAGVPSLKTAAAHWMRRDALATTPLGLVVIMGVLALAFRSVRGVLVPVGTTGLGLVWTVGLMAALDVPIDVATLVIPSLLIAVGSAYATHVVARYYEELETSGPGGDVPGRVLRHLGLPVFVTALTTVLGFASLIVYRVTAIRNLGLFATFGITVLFGLALTFTVAVLALLPPARPARAAQAGDGRLGRLLRAIARFDVRHRWAVIGTGVALIVVCATGIPSVRIETNYLSYFPAGSRVREATRQVSEHFGGTVNFLVVVDGPEGSITRVDTLRRMEALQDFIARLPGVASVTSLVDYVRLLNRALHDGDPAHFTLPETDRAVPQFLLLLGPEAVRPVVNGDYSRAALLVRSELHGSRELGTALAQIRDFAAAAFPPGFSVRPTGTVALLHRTADDLTRGQLQSVLLALGVVFATLALLFLSVRMGLVALVPNLVPIVVFFGLLGWAGIPLSISTAVIASIALGIGVDEAIHLLTEFNRQIRVHADQERALRETMNSVGPPVVYTTVALSLGFLAPVLSSFVPVRQFGYLSALNVATSLVADLFFLPALIATVRFVTLWDVLALRLGRAPHQRIALFGGLRASQARIAALLGELRTVAPGELLMARGAPGDAMYVIITGRVQVGSPTRGAPLATFASGDVVGEMGLVRGARRAADVVALEPTEVLVVNERFLAVLRRRYPRIAATILLNLTRILSDRLQRTTDRLVDDASRSEAAGSVG